LFGSSHREAIGPCLVSKQSFRAPAANNGRLGGRHYLSKNLKTSFQYLSPKRNFAKILVLILPRVSLRSPFYKKSVKKLTHPKEGSKPNAKAGGEHLIK
jgi:hypothetical protein